MSSDDNEFERDRQERIERNKQLLSSLGVQKVADRLAHDVEEEGNRKNVKKRKREFSAASAIPVRQSSRSTARATRMRLKVLAEDKDQEVNESDGSDDGSGYSDDDDGKDDGDYGQGESSGVGSSEASESAGDENVVSDGIGVDEVHVGEEYASRGVSDGKDDGRVRNRNDGAIVKGGGRKIAEGGSKKVVKKKTTKKGVKGCVVNTKHWPRIGSNEVQMGYELFERAGGGLMTIVGVQEVASSLSISCDNEEIEAMMEYAVKVTGCHPQCMTFEEFQKLFECLLENRE